ncbi:MAG TPA: tetratricopeptide repeat protein [Thermoanaerobaculia bacterium]|jgi:tetratricopeptide (TPR) repeat protein|nr:tetratricopeptide repeat protein [Thermoanaerobaculia bacterium]
MNRSSALSRPGEIQPQAPLSGYSTKDVANLLGLSAERVRSYVRAGFLSPRQGPRGEYYFSFQDLVLLRTAKGLLAANVPRRRVRIALENLREQLPHGQPLTGVRISAQGHHVVVRDGRDLWNPESGQALFDFELSELAREAATLTLYTPPEDREDREENAEPETAADWYARGCFLEDDSPEEALAAYGRALELDPGLADAHLNLGRLLHEQGSTLEAERHYRQALTARPGDATAAYNLGVALQDLGRLEAAAEAYENALELDRTLADAHYNLAGIYEEMGQREAAFRHLRTYRTMLQG